ncbi:MULTISPECIES: hypothetical protein [Paenibacillus]|uniref:hypothetical protein n=1 Tax=Paenibacillus TaxID=44249 RepID=UPI00119E65A6|nr:hypothetical protein [Paenibacillus sp. IHBB 10380]
MAVKVIDEHPNLNALPIPIAIKDLQGKYVKLKRTEKIKVCWSLLQNKKRLFDQVYHTTFKNYSIIVDFTQRGVYRYKNNRYELRMENSTLYLRKKKAPYETMKVYDNGCFYTSKRIFLMESCQRAGGAEGVYPCFTLRNIASKDVIIKDHHMISILGFGEIALPVLADEEDREYDVHHKDENRCNSKLDNLEVIRRKHHQLYHGQKRERSIIVMNGRGEPIFAPWLLKQVNVQ